MNWLHRRLCASRAWHGWLARDLLPWALSGVALGNDVLEIGSGPGAAADFLLSRAQRLTCVDVDRRLVLPLARRLIGTPARVLCANAAALPLPDAAFDTVACFMMLHHVSPMALQDRVLAEAARVLRPGGTFVLLESRPGVAMTLLHLGDTLQLPAPGSLAHRLERAGFTGVHIGTRTRAIRAQARRA